jgi:hypothetical protein
MKAYPTTQRPPIQQQSLQTLPTITEATENLTFNNIAEIQLQQVNLSTSIAGTSQNGEGASSTQTSEGDQYLSAIPPPPPPPLQVSLGEAELNQNEVQDWDETEEDEAEARENELIRVQ